MSKFIEFLSDWKVAADGINVVEYQAGDMRELPDDVADLALETEGIAKEITADELKKAQAGYEKLVKAAEKAEADAADAESKAADARAAAIAAREKASGARIGRLTDTDEAEAG